jgi:hypothetical protein
MLDHMNTEEITIRPAYLDDQVSLLRLAALDSQDEVPARPLLLAEVGGEPRVALSLSDGGWIADPFHPTAELIALLHRHAKSLQLARKPQLRNRVFPWLRGRHGVAAGARLA